MASTLKHLYCTISRIHTANIAFHTKVTYVESFILHLNKSKYKLKLLLNYWPVSCLKKKINSTNLRGTLSCVQNCELCVCMCVCVEGLRLPASLSIASFAETMEFPWHSGKVLDQLNHQRKQGLLCDCTFVVDGVDFKAHKAVLAACSAYFRALFLEQKDVVHLDISNAAGWFQSASTNMQFHCKNPVVQINPVVLMVVITGLGEVLEFMYTAKLSLSQQNLEDVLAVANFLQMQELVNACSAYQSMAAPAVSLLTLDFDIGEFSKLIINN